MYYFPWAIRPFLCCLWRLISPQCLWKRKFPLIINNIPIRSKKLFRFDLSRASKDFSKCSLFHCFQILWVLQRQKYLNLQLEFHPSLFCIDWRQPISFSTTNSWQQKHHSASEKIFIIRIEYFSGLIRKTWRSIHLVYI